MHGRLVHAATIHGRICSKNALTQAAATLSFLLYFLAHSAAMQCNKGQLRGCIEESLKKLQDLGIVTHQDHAEQEGFWSFALRVQCLLTISGEWVMAKVLAHGLSTWGET